MRKGAADVNKLQETNTCLAKEVAVLKSKLEKSEEALAKSDSLLKARACSLKKLQGENQFVTSELNRVSKRLREVESYVPQTPPCRTKLRR